MHIRLALRCCRPVAGDETTRNFCDSPKPIAPDCLIAANKTRPYSA